MSDLAQQRIKERIESRRNAGRLRTLQLTPDGVDFCSNDYLGLAQDTALSLQVSSQNDDLNNGSTGSRLISGNSPAHENLEQTLATQTGWDSALLFSTGYAANTGLLSAISEPGDLLILDQLAHASQIDGARLGKGDKCWFEHNNLQALEVLLKKPRHGLAFVAVESVYSMDGDEAPLTELATLCNQYDAALIVDEAHAVGVFGSKGMGLVHQLGLQSEVFACVYTWGKALGCHGAMVTGGVDLKNYLINYARSFIYSTAPSPHQVLSMRECWKTNLQAIELREQLHANIALFCDLSGDKATIELLPSRSAIQSIVIPGETQVRKVAAQLQQQGFAVKPIVAPTVPEGRERIRICLSALHTKEQVRTLALCIKNQLAGSLSEPSTK